MKLIDVYNALTQIASKLPTKPTSGIGGMWTPEQQNESEELIYRTYSGGYEHQLISPKFGFEIWETYTYSDGSMVKLTKGTTVDLDKCLEYFGVKL